MNVAQFLQVLGRAKPSALYLIAGPETFLRRQAIDKLLDQHLPLQARGFNYTVFGDTNDGVSQALLAAQTLPVDNPYRAVLLRGPALNNKGIGEKLAGYLDRPSARTLLIVEVEELKKDSLLPDLAASHGLQIDCTALKPYEQTQWIQAYAGASGYQIQSDAAKLLAARVGNSLQEIAANLEKLFDWLEKPGRITAKEVEQVVGETRELPIWELSDAIMAGDAKKALVTVDACLRSGEAPLVLLSVITRMIRQWIQAQDLRQGGASPAKIGKALRIPEFKVNDFVRRVETLPPGWAAQLLRAAADLDDRMKSTPTSPRLLLETLVCRATDRPRSASSGKSPR